ncbi:hypothetical protein HANVADRAFT_62345 [Hanseniaspora valbyensis NRRL Y-1626]|uniref:Uncharacterized protein n=1 Tax=Hanseniaspora valbyensis NRRL Y-1626 TaxID=766949 RepID=A0A1B7TEB4_9ASCO|nr:hypothetical protein HANVADRAFT_62345 [Hanseniaspora valbyensis NRRL Y-1626]
MLLLNLVFTALLAVFTAATSLTIDAASYTPVSDAGHDQMYKLDLNLTLSGYIEYFQGSTIDIVLDYVHHISMPFDNDTIPIYLRNNGTLIFESVGQIETASSDYSNFGKGTTITFAAATDFAVPEDEVLGLYMTLYVGFISGNDFYIYSNPDSVSSVTPGTNQLGVTVAGTLATDVYGDGPDITQTTAIDLSFASPTATPTSMYNFDAEIAWVQNENVLSVSTAVPVVEIFATVFPECQTSYSFVSANYRVGFDAALSLPTGAQYTFAAAPSEMNQWTSAGIDINPTTISGVQTTTLSDGAVETVVFLNVPSTSPTGSYYIFGGAAIATAGLEDGLYTFSHYGSVVCASGTSTTIESWADGQVLSVYNAINISFWFCSFKESAPLSSSKSLPSSLSLASTNAEDKSFRSFNIFGLKIFKIMLYCSKI